MKRPRAIVVETVFGWEPAFWDEESQNYAIEPGFALPTKQEAEQVLQHDLEQASLIDAQQRRYSSQLDYACGILD